MYNGEDIKNFQEERRQNILKGFGVDFEKAQETDIEKAHQDGDMHPNGKWVWRQSANGGKGDWRVANSKKRSSVKPSAATSTSTTKFKVGQKVKYKNDPYGDYYIDKVNNNNTVNITYKGVGKFGVTNVPLKDLESNDVSNTKTSSRINFTPENSEKYSKEMSKLFYDKGYVAVSKSSGAISVYKIGDRKVLKNLKAHISASDYIDWGGNDNVKKELEPLIKEAVKNVAEGKTSAPVSKTTKTSSTKNSGRKRATTSKTKDKEVRGFVEMYDDGTMKLTKPYSDMTEKEQEQTAEDYWILNNQRVNPLNEYKAQYEWEELQEEGKTESPTGKNQLDNIKKWKGEKKTTSSSKSSSSTINKVPSGKKIIFDTYQVEVYDDKGKKVYSGLLRDYPYKKDSWVWNPKDKNYDSSHGYKMVGK